VKPLIPAIINCLACEGAVLEKQAEETAADLPALDRAGGDDAEQLQAEAAAAARNR